MLGTKREDEIEEIGEIFSFSFMPMGGRKVNSI